MPPYQWRATGGYLPPADGGVPAGPPGFLPGPQPAIMAYLVPAFPWPVPAPAPAAEPPAPPAPAPPAPPSIPGATCAGGIRKGINYLYPAKHTHIHFIRGLDEPWKEENNGKGFDFHIFVASCKWTVKDLIEQLGGDDTMAVTEVYERGGGAWQQGATIPYKDDKANKTLAAWGWTEKRGKSQPPVWLVLHNAPE